ncbi:MAG: MerR family transcriptional regulator [Pseudomonadota bacterium]
MSTTEPTEENGLFPIRTVAHLTGVNPITLRAWERRYGLIQPVRTEKGHRLYSLRDIELIRRILGLIDQGISIGQVPHALALPPPPSRSAACDTSTPGDWEIRYRDALDRFDEARLDALEAEALCLSNPDEILDRLLLPLLDELALTATISAEQEARFHFARMRLALQLANRVRSLKGMHPRAPRLLLATPPPEHGDFERLRLAWQLRRRGFLTLTPGNGASLRALRHTAQACRADAIVLLVKHDPPAAVLGSALEALTQDGTPILAVGSCANKYLTRFSELDIPTLGEDIDALVEKLGSLN